MSQGKRNQGEQTATVVPVLPELLEGKDGLLHFDGKIENIRGHQLYYYSLFPSLNKKQVLRGIVFHLHGIGDHSRAYTHFYEELCAHQYGVIAYDMISHGASDNDIHDVRAHSVAFDHFVEDTNQFLTFAKSELLPKYGITCYQSNKNQDQEEKIPLIFTGMSYGTLVGIHTIVSQEHQFDGVILSAPVVSVEWTTSLKIQAAFSKWLSSMIPKARIVPGVNNDWLSRTPGQLESMKNDPYMTVANLTARMGQQSIQAFQKIEEDPCFDQHESFFSELPILFLMGSDDKVTSLEHAKQFHARIPNKDKEFKEFDGLYHCLFHEPEKEQVIGHITEWLNRRFPLLTVKN